MDTALPCARAQSIQSELTHKKQQAEQYFNTGRMGARSVVLKDNTTMDVPFRMSSEMTYLKKKKHTPKPMSLLSPGVAARILEDASHLILALRIQDHKLCFLYKEDASTFPKMQAFNKKQRGTKSLISADHAHRKLREMNARRSALHFCGTSGRLTYFAENKTAKPYSCEYYGSLAISYNEVITCGYGTEDILGFMITSNIPLFSNHPRHEDSTELTWVSALERQLGTEKELELSTMPVILYDTNRGAIITTSIEKLLGGYTLEQCKEALYWTRLFCEKNNFDTRQVGLALWQSGPVDILKRVCEFSARLDKSQLTLSDCTKQLIELIKNEKSTLEDIEKTLQQRPGLDFTIRQCFIADQAGIVKLLIQTGPLLSRTFYSTVIQQKLQSVVAIILQSRKEEFTQKITTELEQSKSEAEEHDELSSLSQLSKYRQLLLDKGIEMSELRQQHMAYTKLLLQYGAQFKDELLPPVTSIINPELCLMALDQGACLSTSTEKEDIVNNLIALKDSVKLLLIGFMLNYTSPKDIVPILVKNIISYYGIEGMKNVVQELFFDDYDGSPLLAVYNLNVLNEMLQLGAPLPSSSYMSDMMELMHHDYDWSKLLEIEFVRQAIKESSAIRDLLTEDPKAKLQHTLKSRDIAAKREAFARQYSAKATPPPSDECTDLLAVLFKNSHPLLKLNKQDTLEHIVQQVLQHYYRPEFPATVLPKLLNTKAPMLPRQLHGIDHVIRCMKIGEAVNTLFYEHFPETFAPLFRLKDLDTLLPLAIIYHDVVAEVEPKENEERRAADFFKRDMLAAGYAPETVQIVASALRNKNANVTTPLPDDFVADDSCPVAERALRQLIRLPDCIDITRCMNVPKDYPMTARHDEDNTFDSHFMDITEEQKQNHAFMADMAALMKSSLHLAYISGGMPPFEDTNENYLEKHNARRGKQDNLVRQYHVHYAPDACQVMEQKTDTLFKQWMADQANIKIESQQEFDRIPMPTGLSTADKLIPGRTKHNPEVLHQLHLLKTQGLRKRIASTDPIHLSLSSPAKRTADKYHLSLRSDWLLGKHKADAWLEDRYSDSDDEAQPPLRKRKALSVEPMLDD